MPSWHWRTWPLRTCCPESCDADRQASRRADHDRRTPSVGLRACKAVGLPRSALYKPTTDHAVRDAPVIDAVNAVVDKRRRWGFWKCFRRLRSDGHGWNHKRVYRVYCGMRLNLKRKSKRRLVTRERQPLLASHELNRVWPLDFMRDTLYDGRPFRTLNVIDEGNREALRIECGTSIPSARVVRIMNQLIEAYGKPEAVRLDNGPELTADKFTDWAKERGVKLLFIQPGKPNQNAFVERFNRSFREEVLDAWLFNAVSEVQAAADDWLRDYNEYRPHESLGDVPPVVFKPRVFNAYVFTSDLSALRGSLRGDLQSPRFSPGEPAGQIQRIEPANLGMATGSLASDHV